MIFAECHNQSYFAIAIDKLALKIYPSPVMARSLLQAQLPVDDWILLPVPQSRAEAIQKGLAHGRQVRHLLFDIGGGLVRNLSPENHKIVMDHCRLQYESYVFRCKQAGRTPMLFRHTDKGYICWWKWQQKSLYVRWDVPRKLREYEQVA